MVFPVLERTETTAEPLADARSFITIEPFVAEASQGLVTVTSILSAFEV